MEPYDNNLQFNRKNKALKTQMHKTIWTKFLFLETLSNCSSYAVTYDLKELNEPFKYILE